VGPSSIWIPGRPATFATRSEIPWRAKVLSCLAGAQPGEWNGLTADFILPTLRPRGMWLDLDNLCEPLFSALIGGAGWFGGRRPNLCWWRATKREGNPTGASVEPSAGAPPEVPSHFRLPLVDAVYSSALPTKATDPKIPGWLASVAACNLDSGACALRLQFGADAVNIADMSAGKVKPAIDCLYPVLGGAAGAPEDWRIDWLQVEKGVAGAGASGLRVTIWPILP
jgi:hypothetical protein